MKKFVSVVLSLAVFFQCFVFNINVYSDEMKTTMAQYVLAKLDIVDLEGVSDFNSTVTRAEFASYINNILKANPTKKKTYFIDVPNSYWAAESINALVELGIISHAGDGRFNPEDTITYAQACKLLVHTLGYAPFTEFEKQGMMTYVTLAFRLGFSINVVDTDAITFEDTIDLIYRAMQVDTAVSIMENEVAKTVVDEGRTLFSIYFDAYVGEGKINAYFGNSLTETPIEEDEVVVGNTKFKKDADFVLDGLIGSYCDIFYTDINEQKTLIYAEIMNAEEKLITSEMITAYNPSTMTISYLKTENANKVSTEKIPVKTEIIYNGKSFGGNVSEIINEFINGSKKGEIRIVNSGRGTENQIVIVKSYNVFVAGAYINDKLYGYYDSKTSFDVNPSKNLIIKTDTGVKSKIPERFPQAMLVAESEDKTIAEIILCGAQEQITVKALKDNNTKIVKEDGKKVELDKSIIKYKTVQLGGNYTVVYDIYGDVINIMQGNESEFKIGYLRYINYVENLFDNNDWYIRLYDRADSKFYDLKVAKRIKVDNRGYDKDNYKGWLYAIPGNTTLVDKTVTIERQVIRYKTNSAGEITEIDTYNLSDVEDKNATLTRIADGSEKMLYLANTSRFGMNVLVDTNATKFLTIPVIAENGSVDLNGEAMPETEELYSNNPTLINWDHYYIEAYKFSDATLAADIIVLKQNPTITNESFMMIESISQSLDGEGEVVDVINGFINGGRVSFKMTKASSAFAKTLKVGDVISFDTTADASTVTAITKAFDYETKTFEDNGSYIDRNRYWYYGNISNINDQGLWNNSTHQIVKAYPYEQKNNAIIFAYNLQDAAKGDTKYASMIPAAVTVYDPNLYDNQVYKGTVKDIVTYKNAATDGDLVLICSRNANALQTFVYKVKR